MPATLPLMFAWFEVVEKHLMFFFAAIVKGVGDICEYFSFVTDPFNLFPKILMRFVSWSHLTKLELIDINGLKFLAF